MLMLVMASPEPVKITVTGIRGVADTQDKKMLDEKFSRVVVQWCVCVCVCVCV